MGDIHQLKPKSRGVHADNPDIICPACEGLIRGGNVTFFGPKDVVIRLIIAKFEMVCPHCEASLKLTLEDPSVNAPVIPLRPR